MKKLDFAYAKKKCADQLVQFLFFLNPKLQGSVAAQAVKYQALSETLKTSFLASWLICGIISNVNIRL